MHTSIIAVVLIENKEDKVITIEPSDVRITYYKDSGNGGQHRNKTLSGVRLQYRDLKIECCDTRDQRKNKEIAFERLREKIKETESRRLVQDNLEEQRKQNQNLGKRGNYHRNYNYKRNSVETDDGNTFQLDRFLKGEMQWYSNND